MRSGAGHELAHLTASGMRRAAVADIKCVKRRPHSERSESIGLTRVARRAGMKLARSEIAKTTTATVTNVKMSVGLTSKSKDLRSPVTANAPIRPIVIPAAARSMRL